MEVLLSSDEAEISKISVNVWNPVTGSKLLSLRGPPALHQSLSLVRDEGVLIVEAGKPFVHIWQTGHSLQSSRRILCPRKPGALTITPDGTYLLVGIEEKIYVWQVATGRVVSVISSAHYRPVTVLKLTDDGSHLISGGEDGIVLTWQFLNLVSGHSTLPKYSWTDHSAPITGIHVGFGGAKGSIFTVSSDRTAKIYSLLTGALLLSVSYPVPLTAIVADVGEFSFYVGATSGSIYQMKLQSVPRSIDHHITSDAMADCVLKKHKEPITCLSISADGQTLASGDTEGLILLWDTDTQQAIKTIVGGKSKVTNLLFWLGNPENWKGGKKPQVIFPEVPKLVEQSEIKIELDQVVVVWNRHSKTDSAITEIEHTSDSSNIQLARMKAELAKSERINSRLHEFCLDKVLGHATVDVNRPKPIRKSVNVSRRRKIDQDTQNIEKVKKKKKKSSTPSLIVKKKRNKQESIKGKTKKEKNVVGRKRRQK